MLDYTVAAISGVSAILDHRSSALPSIIDAFVALSCEALRADTSPFNLMDSGDGSVASDFKVFFRDSKLVNSGKDASAAEISEMFLAHSTGSAKVLSMALGSLASSLVYLGINSFRRTELLLSGSISDMELSSRLSEMLAATALEELYASSQATRLKEDMLFVHKIYELLDVVTKEFKETMGV